MKAFAELKSAIAVDNFDLAMELVEEIETGITDIKDILNAKDSRIAELETQLREAEEVEDWETIDTPLGRIFIANVKGNLNLQNHIDSFKSRIKRMYTTQESYTIV